MTVYMAVTADEYELPIALSESVETLAKMTNTKKGTIHTDICRGSKTNKMRFIKVEIEEGDD